MNVTVLVIDGKEGFLVEKQIFELNYIYENEE